jgi:hypothetical protein
MKLIYKNGKFVKATKLDIILSSIKYWFTKWKLINSFKYFIISNKSSIFILSSKQQEESEKIYKEKGTISYEFYPTGIGWGLRIHCLKNDEIIDITDYSTF